MKIETYEDELIRYNAWLDEIGGTDFFEGDDKTREWFDAGMPVVFARELCLELRKIETFKSAMDMIFGSRLAAVEARDGKRGA